MRTKHKRVGAGILAAAAMAAGSFAAAPQGGAKNLPPQIGDIHLSSPDPNTVLTFEQNPKTKKSDFDIRGKSVTLSSARYDMTAPHITFAIKGGKLTTGTAAGGVLVNVRNPEASQHSSLRATNANYQGATASNPARLHLTGNVRWVYTDPQWEKPLITTANEGDVFFLPDGTNRITLTHPDISGTPIEPPAAPKKK